MNLTTLCRISATAFALLFSTALNAQSIPRVRTVQTNPIQADLEALARGYEEAYRIISNQNVYITFQRADQGFVTITGIRNVRASGGVITITRERDAAIVVPANAVVAISTEPPTPAQ